jgi:hypothetical protein
VGASQGLITIAATITNTTTIIINITIITIERDLGQEER